MHHVNVSMVTSCDHVNGPHFIVESIPFTDTYMLYTTRQLKIREQRTVVEIFATPIQIFVPVIALAAINIRFRNNRSFSPLISLRISSNRECVNNSVFAFQLKRRSKKCRMVSKIVLSYSIKN